MKNINLSIQIPKNLASPQTLAVAIVWLCVLAALGICLWLTVSSVKFAWRAKFSVTDAKAPPPILVNMQGFSDTAKRIESAKQLLPKAIPTPSPFTTNLPE